MPPPPQASLTKPSVAIVTCSMAKDIDLFALLVASIDQFVSKDIMHRVVVPQRDMALFAQFATDQRQILAQEDLLPVRLWKSPKWLSRLTQVRQVFRRPFYLTSDGIFCRGWMLQQFIKIEMTRRASETAVMHVDSDVCFFRAFETKDAFHQGRTRYFRVRNNSTYDMHATWLRVACDFLGLPHDTPASAHYIENCVLWDSAVTRALCARVKEHHQKPLHRILLTSQSMSEHYLYGVFADVLDTQDRLHPESISFCVTSWEDSNFEAFKAQLEQGDIDSKHCAVAIQSTQDLGLEDRMTLYRQITQDTAARAGGG